MGRSIRLLFLRAAVLAGVTGAIAACDSMSTLGGSNSNLGSGGSSGGDNGSSSGGGDAGSSSGGGQDTGDSGPSCTYTDDKSFCACQGWNCGGATVPDSNGINESVYCGACPNTQYCMFTDATGPGAGTCGGTNPLQYDWQKEKIDMLVSMGENDDPTVQYGYAQNIQDGRGYTVGKAGFCTGTGDFIIVAACYNDAKPNNVLQKYWGTRNSSGVAENGLIYYDDLYVSTGNNQGATTLIDSLGNFPADVATAAKDPLFRACQDSMSDAFNLAPAAMHIDQRGLKGALTTGFLYDTELNFGDDDDTGDGGTVGAITVMSRADTDYGSGLPTDFTGKAWEESRWLGYFIYERVKVMAANDTWRTDTDQNATWEAARRLNTAMSNATESATNLDMDYDFVSAYKAGSSSAGTPCWTSGLATTLDTESSVYDVSTEKPDGGTDETQWSATFVAETNNPYQACPPNPTT
jgi:hypothetical protein